LALVSFDLFLTRIELVTVAGEEAETVRLRAEEKAEAVTPPIEPEVGAMVRVVKWPKLGRSKVEMEKVS